MKTLLMILDGWGIGPNDKTNAIYSTPTPYMDYLNATYPHSQLQASGENVGLPDGQMGNSEVGHLNIGAGRVVYQDLVKINRACRDNSILDNPEIINAFTYAQQHNVRLHFMGLVSDGGVHSSLDHLFKLCEISKHYGLTQTFVHCFMDGRDTDPHAGKGYIAQLQKQCEATDCHIASIVGRFYAMDRDKRWNRIKEAYDLLLEGKGYHSTDMVQAMQESYDADVTDEFIKPIQAVDNQGNPIGLLQPDDVVIFFNFRNDRAKELTIVLTQEDKPEEGMHTMPLHYYCMVPYDSSFKGLHVLFDKENVTHTMGQIISERGLKQLRIAETEKFAHVTFFYSGGRESEFEGEDRILIPSPKVATYDLQPEMSAPEVTKALVEAIESQKYDYIVLNFANGDMVGHTGVYTAIQQAVRVIDHCVEQVIETVKRCGYEAIIIADHGNADHAINEEDGTPNTAHSLNPVPFIYVTEKKNVKCQDGILADVAPSLLHIMDIPQPKEMTGHNLIED